MCTKTIVDDKYFFSSVMSHIHMMSVFAFAVLFCFFKSEKKISNQYVYWHSHYVPKSCFPVDPWHPSAFEIEGDFHVLKKVWKCRELHVSNYKKIYKYKTFPFLIENKERDFPFLPTATTPSLCLGKCWGQSCVFISIIQKKNTTTTTAKSFPWFLYLLHIFSSWEHFANKLQVLQALFSWWLC